MLSISLFPGFYLNQIAAVAGTFTHLNVSSVVLDDATTILQYIGLANLVLLVVFSLIMIAKKMTQSKMVLTSGPTWGCGYSAGDFKHQYTSTSYVENLRELVGPTVDIKGQHISFQEKEIFPERRHYATHVDDLIEEKIVQKPVHYVTEQLAKAGWAQTGMINHYLVYPLVFLIIISLLTLIGVL